tara:strand:+ start:2843 stop:3736 length:894 start_codon:yes stop_codon:yes gene_type:complete
MEAAEKLKITVENLNSMLTTSFRKISDTRKRTKKLKAVSILRKRRKKKESKLEIPSEFKKSTKRINNILPKGLGSNMLTSIVELISLLLVGVAVTNIEELKEKIDKLRGGFDKNAKFLKGIIDSVYQGTRGFISLFESEDRDQQLKDAEEQAEKLKNTEKDQLEIQKLLEKLRKEYEIVEKRFKNADSGTGVNLDDFKLNQTGVLSTGETFEIDKKNNKIKLISPEGEEKTVNLKEFIKENKNELPNIAKFDNQLISDAAGDFKIDSSKLIANLDLSATFDEQEIETINNIYYEVRT